MICTSVWAKCSCSYLPYKMKAKSDIVMYINKLSARKFLDICEGSISSAQ